MVGRGGERKREGLRGREEKDCYEGMGRDSRRLEGDYRE